jgi:hypothetical protein
VWIPRVARRCTALVMISFATQVPPIDRDAVNSRGSGACAMGDRGGKIDSFTSQNALPTA